MMFKRSIPLLVLSLVITTSACAQTRVMQDPVVASPDQVEYYTYMWEGERLPDGRPYVSDDLLERLKNLKLEDAWQLLNEMGYRNQFEGNWRILKEDEAFVGRALTALYVPRRPDVQEKLLEDGHNLGHIGPQNSWPIDMLQNGDVYVADAFGKIAQGTMIGDNLGTTIFNRTGTGVVFDSSIRDAEGLEQIDGFNVFARDFHPSFLEEVMLLGINVPLQIGNVTVFPGDVILAKKIGVLFIPAHMVEHVVITAELVALRDEFAHERIQAGVYTGGQIDTKWTDEIEEDFLQWIQHPSRIHRLPVPLEEMGPYLEQRTW